MRRRGEAWHFARRAVLSDPNRLRTRRTSGDHASPRRHRSRQRRLARWFASALGRGQYRGRTLVVASATAALGQDRGRVHDRPWWGLAGVGNVAEGRWGSGPRRFFGTDGEL